MKLIDENYIRIRLLKMGQRIFPVGKLSFKRIA